MKTLRVCLLALSAVVWSGCADSPTDPAPNPFDTADLSNLPTSLPADIIQQLKVATSGDLSLMPPDTGLPVASSSVSEAFEAIPQDHSSSSEIPSTDAYAEQQLPDRTPDRTSEAASTEPATEALHG